MEFYHLQTLVIVAEEKSITRAAKRLHTTPPSVSTHIKALETEFNVQLFERLPGGMKITDKGKILVEKAQATLLAVQDFVNHAVRLQEELMGTIRLGANATAAFLKLPALIHRLKDTSPGITLSLSMSNTGKIISQLKEQTLDVGFVFVNEGDADLNRRFICAAELVVAAPKAWESEISQASWQEIAERPWIYADKYCPFQQIADDLFRERGVEYNRHLLSEDDAMKCDLVAAAIGLSLIEKSEAEQAVKNGKICIWKTDKIYCDLYIAWLTRRSEDPLIKALVANLLQIWEPAQ